MKLASRKEFPLTLLETLIKETPLQFRKGKKRAITGLEIAEEKEQDASRQRRRDEKAVASAAAADAQLEEEKGRTRLGGGSLGCQYPAPTQLAIALGC